MRLPGRGTLPLTWKGVVKQSQRIRRAGTAELLVKPRNAAKRRLDRRGNLTVKANVTYRPRLGLPRTKSKKLTLVKKR